VLQSMGSQRDRHDLATKQLPNLETNVDSFFSNLIKNVLTKMEACGRSGCGPPLFSKKSLITLSIFWSIIFQFFSLNIGRKWGKAHFFNVSEEALRWKENLNFLSILF